VKLLLANCQQSSEGHVKLNAAINSRALHHLSEFINDDKTRGLYTSTDAQNNALKQHNKQSSSTFACDQNNHAIVASTEQRTTSEQVLENLHTG
jgi:hypothetical protein